MLNKIKTWIKENGVVGFASLIVAVVAMFFGMKFIVWGALGFFFGKNWQIVIGLWQSSRLKSKIDGKLN